MGFKASMKAQKAYVAQGKGENETAMALYEEAMELGLDDPKYILTYALMLIRSGEYAKAREMLVKIQKKPMTDDQKINLFVDYACCVYKMGEIEKGINLLERQHAKQPTGLVYQTLGYLYCERFDPSHKEEVIARWEKANLEAAQEAANENHEMISDANETEEKTEIPTQEELQKHAEEKWDTELKKALDFILEAVDYDDEDPVCLDNAGQFYYRVLGDKQAAKEWFNKAIELKEGQIDTLYFLSRYDLDEGNTTAALEKLEKALEGRFSPLNYCTKSDIEQEIARIKTTL